MHGVMSKSTVKVQIFKIASLILVVLASAHLPLVGAYDYEAALFCALLGLVFIPILIPRGEACATHVERVRQLFACFGTALFYFVVTNAIFMGTAWIRDALCDIEKGILYQLSIALPSQMLTASIWAWLNIRFRRCWVRRCLYVAWIGADMGLTLFCLYEGPPIVSYGQFYGYFAGSIYDESMDVIGRLFLYRIGTWIWIASFIGASLLPQMRFRVLCLFLGMSFVGIYHYALSDAEVIIPFGRDSLSRALWATIEREGYRLHYRPQSKQRREMEAERRRLIRNYDRDYGDLASFFQTTIEGKAEIWLFPSSAMKGAYLGARRTSFARLWKREIYLVENGAGSTLARHEMAHLFAASFSTSFLGLSGGVIPSLGWTEGLAMAAEWPIETFDLHTWAKGILWNRETFGDIDPLMLMYGFWGIPSRVAYILSGSFVRWLIETRGIETVKLMSSSDPGDFKAKFGESLEEVFQAWKTAMLSRPTPPRAVEMARVSFGSKSIWTKRCARSQAFRQSRYAECAASLSCSLETEVSHLAEKYDKSNGEARFDLAELEMLYLYYQSHGALEAESQSVQNLNDERWNTFSSIDENDLKHGATKLTFSLHALQNEISRHIVGFSPSSMPENLQIVWGERTADILWYSNQYVLSSMLYRMILKISALPESMARRMEIKAQAAETMQSPVSRYLREWFSESHAVSIHEMSLLYSHSPILSYLSFVNAMHSGAYETARSAYVRVLVGLSSADRATQLPVRAMREFWRLASYL